MKFSKTFAVLILLTGLVLSTTVSQAAGVTAGAKCTKLGSVVKASSRSFVCTKVGTKKLWVVKKTTTPKASPSPSLTTPPPVVKTWAGPCDFDTSVPSEWKSVQTYLRSFNYCDAPYKFEPANLGFDVPKTQLTETLGARDLYPCKIEDQRSLYEPIAFAPKRLPLHPRPTTRFQVIPIETLDAPYKGKSPNDEYGHYFRYIESFLEYIADGTSDVTFNVPKEYVKVATRIESAGVGKHGPPTQSGRKFFQDAISALDDVVNFSQVDYVLVVIPGDSNPTLLGVQPWVRGETREGPVLNGMSLQPISATSQLGNMEYLGAQPFGVLHELFHGGGSLDDHYGDRKWKLGPNLGMANWGLMSTIKTDLSGWEKWLMGFTMDSQVACVNGSAESAHWLIPGGIKSSMQKLLVIPISKSKVIVVESVRAKGVNYKLAKQSEGALVYTVDASEQRHGYGMSLVMPADRVMEVESPTVKFLGASAPLKLGESVTVEGYQIKVLEAGAFGDVISVVGR